MENPPQKAVLVTGHYLFSRRRAGFHWLADSLHRRGWEVLFFTAAISRLSRLRGDYRFAYPVLRDANRIRRASDKLWSFVWYTPWHAATVRWRLLERLTAPLFARYGELPIGEAAQFVRRAELVIFESTPGLMLFDQFRRLSLHARTVYRVSDDMDMRKNHPVVLDAERRVAERFDLVSVPSEPLLAKFAHLPTTRLQPHGLPKQAFDRRYGNPYPSGPHVNCVFVGASMLDRDFLSRAARLLPHWAFHVIGPLGRLPRAANIVTYGELEFHATLPYLQHADVGLHPMERRSGAESLSATLKVMQYTYCRLPIVAPDFLHMPEAHVFHYRPGDDESIARALRAAWAMDRRTIDRSGARSWDEVVDELVAGEGADAANSKLEARNTKQT